MFICRSNLCVMKNHLNWISAHNIRKSSLLEVFILKLLVNCHRYKFCGYVFYNISGWQYIFYHHDHRQQHRQNIALFGSYPSLEDSVRFAYYISPSYSHFFEFRKSNSFYRARSSALRSAPNLEDQFSVFMSPSDRVAQLYPQAPSPNFVSIFDLHGYGILTRFQAEVTFLSIVQI
jgi:hypothetical protein